MKTLQDIKRLLQNYTFRTFLVYIIIGFGGLFIDFGSYLLILNFSAASPYLANLFSMFLTLNVSFSLNTRYNFKVKDQIFRRWTQYMIIGFVGILISEGLILLFIEQIELSDEISKLLTVPIIAVIQYTLHRFFTYKPE